MFDNMLLFRYAQLLLLAMILLITMIIIIIGMITVIASHLHFTPVIKPAAISPSVYPSFLQMSEPPPPYFPPGLSGPSAPSFSSGLSDCSFQSDLDKNKHCYYNWSWSDYSIFSNVYVTTTSLCRSSPNLSWLASPGTQNALPLFLNIWLKKNRFFPSLIMST